MGWVPIDTYKLQEYRTYKDGRTLWVNFSVEGRLLTLSDSTGAEISLLMRPDMKVCVMQGENVNDNL